MKLSRRTFRAARIDPSGSSSAATAIVSATRGALATVAVGLLLVVGAPPYPAVGERPASTVPLPPVVLTGASARQTGGPCGVNPCAKPGDGPCGANPCSEAPPVQGPCGPTPCQEPPAQGPCGANPCPEAPPEEGACGATPCREVSAEAQRDGANAPGPASPASPTSTAPVAGGDQSSAPVVAEPDGELNAASEIGPKDSTSRPVVFGAAVVVASAVAFASLRRRRRA